MNRPIATRRRSVTGGRPPKRTAEQNEYTRQVRLKQIAESRRAGMLDPMLAHPEVAEGTQAGVPPAASAIPSDPKTPGSTPLSEKEHAVAGTPQGVPTSSSDETSEEMELAAKAYAKYVVDPVAYVQDIILGTQFTIVIEPHQADLLDAVARYDRVAVKAANGMGKDTTTAWLIEWFLLTHPMAKVPCTSGVFRQVYSMLWSEIAKWSRHSLASPYLRPLSTRVEVVGYEKEWFAEGFTAKEESEAEGYHAPHLLYCITEAKAVNDSIWRAVFKACTGVGNKIFAQSVPGRKMGDFHKVFTELRTSWKTYSFPSAVKADNPETKKAEWWPTTRLISKVSIDEKLAYGEDGPLFQAGVLANFIDESEDSVIPLSWLEAANHRWEVLKEKDGWEPFLGLGVDVARGWTDKNSIAHRYGSAIKYMERFLSQDTMVVTGRVASVLRAQKGGKAVVDVIGVGAGVVDRLKELPEKFKVVPFLANGACPYSDRSGELLFLNMRSYAWWHLRDLLNPAFEPDLALPPDDKLTGDLVTPKWKMTSGGKVQVQSKEEIKEKLGRSTDDGDAVVMIFANLRAGAKARIRWLK